MHVLVALDKFKDALTAPEACAAVMRALRACRPEWSVEACPLTDGGEGFVEVLVGALSGDRQICRVTGPRGDPVDAMIGWVRWGEIPVAARALLALPDGGSERDGSGRVAVIEMAQASGLALLSPEQRDPWQTTTLGTGELIRAASEQGAVAIVLGVGGSATNDLGLGALAALGLRACGASGEGGPVPRPAEWVRVHRLGGRIMPLPPLRIACDVTNPLLGPHGATRTYGPQKGLRTEALDGFEAQMERMADHLDALMLPPSSARHRPGAGAAGGITFGLVTAVGAEIVNGFELVSAWCGLSTRLQWADIVITGEGRFDETSWAGKGPGAVARRAQQEGKAVHVFAGQVRARPALGVALHAITPEGQPLEAALRAAAENLSAAVGATFGAVPR